MLLVIWKEIVVANAPFSSIAARTGTTLVLARSLSMPKNSTSRQYHEYNMWRNESTHDNLSLWALPGWFVVDDSETRTYSWIKKKNTRGSSVYSLSVKSQVEQLVSNACSAKIGDCECEIFIKFDF